MLASCNIEAVEWIDRWPKWPTPALTVYGPKSCGKTHLARVFMAKSGAVAISADDLASVEPPGLLDGYQACLLEDADTLPELEEQLLHLYNTAQESGCHILLTASAPPAHWNITLADLRSRLIAAPLAGIGPPDDFLIASVLVKLFADRQLQVNNEVIKFMLLRMERSFEAAQDMVDAIDKEALSQHRNITIPLVSQVLHLVSNI